MTRGEAICRLEEGAPFSALYDEVWENALIMAIEALKSEPTYEQVKDSCNKHGLVLVDKDLWNSMVLELQTREVVRCKDCKRNHTEECSMWYESDDHQEQYSWNNPDDYCSRGERKDEVTE